MPEPDLSSAPRPRVVASDLDGTLLRADATVSDRTRAVLAALDGGDVTVVFVTARPPRFLDNVASTVGGHGLVLCANGAYVYEVATGTVLEEHTLDDALVLELARDLRDAVPGVTFAVEQATSGGAEEAFGAQRRLPEGSPIGPVETLLRHGRVGKLLARTDDVPPEEFHDLLASVVGDRAEVAYSGAVGLGEVTAPGVTKAAVLARWCEAHGVTADQVWAFGDMPNDLSMLRWAGTSFAVANAHPDVLAAATHRIGHHDDDAVARVLEHLV
ncbi:HAD family hydrolase [Solicola sp. PLA-1-18]|uniref:HAD family hydrolase n=1 Tax=Solicola sp. PLA-1-18 TaxID=3380532 RepID=UPI003B7F621E